ncbi:unnamed protein product [Closterium sp. NIES-54]
MTNSCLFLTTPSPRDPYPVWLLMRLPNEAAIGSEPCISSSREMTAIAQQLQCSSPRAALAGKVQSGRLTCQTRHAVPLTRSFSLQEPTMSSERSISPRHASARLVASGIACCAGTWNAVASIPRRATICAAANADGRAWGEGDGGGEVAGGGRSGGGGEVEEGEGGGAVRQVSESAEGSRPVGVHFIGIGGSGLSALAAVALKQVSGARRWHCRIVRQRDHIT